MSTRPIVNFCPNCGAPLGLAAPAKCNQCHVPVLFVPFDADVTDDSQPTDTELAEADPTFPRARYQLLPPDVCPSCGEEKSYFPTSGACYSCGRRSVLRTKRVPHLIAMILVGLPLLENELAIEQYITTAPQEYSAILALTASVIDIGVRFRSTYPNEDIRNDGSGLRYLSANDIWMLDLTLDVMYMLAGMLGREGARWEFRDPEVVSTNLAYIDKATRHREWKRALRQAGAGRAQFQQLRAHVPQHAPPRR